jgi:hypothetical protein
MLSGITANVRSVPALAFGMAAQDAANGCHELPLYEPKLQITFACCNGRDMVLKNNGHDSEWLFKFIVSDKHVGERTLSQLSG